MVLDNGYIKSFCSAAKQLTIFNESFRVPINKFVTARIDPVKNEIKKESIFMMKWILYNFKSIYSECSTNKWAQCLLEDNLSKTGTLLVSDFLNKLYTEIQNLIDKSTHFFFTQTTLATPENIAIFSDIVSNIFQLKDNLIDYYHAYLKAMTLYLSKQLPEYQNIFEKSENILNYELYSNYFCSFLKIGRAHV